jgi:hypothetical protein
MNTGTFDPASGDLTTLGIAASQQLFPATTDTEDGVTYVQFNGIDTLTGGTQAYSIGINSVILPVELIDFDAQLYNGVVECAWITATEINSDYFEVERRTENE